jgi:hypothetical protein
MLASLFAAVFALSSAAKMPLPTITRSLIVSLSSCVNILFTPLIFELFLSFLIRPSDISYSSAAQASAVFLFLSGSEPLYFANTFYIVRQTALSWVPIPPKQMLGSDGLIFYRFLNLFYV